MILKRKRFMARGEACRKITLSSVSDPHREREGREVRVREDTREKSELQRN